MPRRGSYETQEPGFRHARPSGVSVGRARVPDKVRLLFPAKRANDGRQGVSVGQGSALPSRFCPGKAPWRKLGSAGWCAADAGSGRRPPAPGKNAPPPPGEKINHSRSCRPRSLTPPPSRLFSVSVTCPSSHRPITPLACAAGAAGGAGGGGGAAALWLHSPVGAVGRELCFQKYPRLFAQTPVPGSCSTRT